MANSIFFVIVLSLFLTYSFGSISFFGVNRSFSLMYKGVLENSCSYVDEGGNSCAPYFDKEKLIDNVERYFELNLPRYVSTYSTSYFFFNVEDGSYCTSKVCRGVKISLKSEINYMFHYEKAKEYRIHSNHE